MSGRKTEVDNCLNQLSCYKSKQRVFQDLLYLLEYLPSLSPQISTITNENGKSSTLINLIGSIPMYFRSQKYMIPVSLWIPEAYPYNPPIAYVIPSKDMIIKPKNKHVDSKGLCYLAYLSEWNYKTSNLYELVNSLSTAFGDDPPLCEKPKIIYENNNYNGSKYTYENNSNNSNSNNSNGYNNGSFYNSNNNNTNKDVEDKKQLSKYKLMLEKKSISVEDFNTAMEKLGFKDEIIVEKKKYNFWNVFFRFL